MILDCPISVARHKQQADTKDACREAMAAVTHLDGQDDIVLVGILPRKVAKQPAALNLACHYLW